MSNRDAKQFVHWFRESSPYIHRFRGQTFVIAFGGQTVAEGHMARLAADLALLNSLGIHLLLVHGAMTQIDARLDAAGLSAPRVHGRRVTDAAILPHVMAAVGSVRFEIEALLTQNKANSPMQGSSLKVAGGNFVLAQPLGVIEGVDFLHTGKVRRIDASAIQKRLDHNEVVLLSPLAYSPTGEIFNINAEELATSTAIAMGAAKLIFLTDDTGLRDEAHNMIRQITIAQAEARLAHDDALPKRFKRHLKSAIDACKAGVERVHLISRNTDGALLIELFTRDGCGTLISTDPFENLRPAEARDLPGIIDLLYPLEKTGALVKRERDTLESQLGHYVVLERDEQIIACAALIPYAGDGMGELACLAVHANYRRQGRGDQLFQYISREARQQGLHKLFVLTTQTAHWFVERGFEAADIDALPAARQQRYNFNRRSKVFVKPLD